jgi:cytoskeletal protein CcmA (bactofilin family)
MAATADTPRLPSDELDDVPVPIVVGASGRFEGLLVFRGRARVDGELVGRVLSRGVLELGETARVDGVIEVDELIIAGSFGGEATARRRIELAATARVKGVLRAPRVALADGCMVDGRCETAPLDPGP